MAGPATGTSRDLDAVAGHQDLVQIGRDLDAAADREGMDGVVSGVKADTVVPWQPQRCLPPARRGNRRQLEHP